MKYTRESWILVAIGSVDLLSTIIFIKVFGAREANPVFKRFWAEGLAMFIIAKIMLLLGPVAILEWARRRRPRFTQLASRAAIVGYICLYFVGVARLNHQPQAYRPSPSLNPYMVQIMAMTYSPGMARSMTPSWVGPGVKYRMYRSRGHD